MNAPTVTIVICARNAARHLERSIPAALAQHHPAARIKVLVIDNGSTDDTAGTARRLGAIVRPCPRHGVARARQMGWRIARSEFVAYLDADCEPPRDWISRALSRFDDPQLAAVGVRLVNAPASTLAEEHIIRHRLLDTDFFFTANAIQFPFLVTAGLVLRRTALESIGGFDLSFGSSTGEDADLCWRLERKGWRLAYDPTIEILHHHRSTIRGMMRQAHWYGRGSAALFARWRTEFGWWRYTDWPPYRRLGKAMLAAPLALLTKRGYRRWEPTLSALDAIAFLTGKWREAARNRVLFL